MSECVERTQSNPISSAFEANCRWNYSDHAFYNAVKERVVLVLYTLTRTIGLILSNCQKIKIKKRINPVRDSVIWSGLYVSGFSGFLFEIHRWFLFSQKNLEYGYVGFDFLGELAPKCFSRGGKGLHVTCLIWGSGKGSEPTIQHAIFCFFSRRIYASFVSYMANFIG